MRLFKLCFLPVLLVTGSLASGQEPSANKLHDRARISGEWASAPTTQGAILVSTGGVETLPSGPTSGAMIGAPVNGPVVGTSMGQCGGGGCGAACASCDHGSCLSRLKAWFCSRPLHACDKQVCYDPIPPLYQFFPCPREGYCPQLAPATCCPQPAHVIHPICSNRQPWANTSLGPCTNCGGCGSACGKTSCGGLGTACGKASCGNGSCGTCDTGCGSASCGGCSSCGSSRGRFFSLGCFGRCCTPSAQCFTSGLTTGGCADGSCGPK
jgi:hypothetical protein